MLHCEEFRKVDSYSNTIDYRALKYLILIFQKIWPLLYDFEMLNVKR